VGAIKQALNTDSVEFLVGVNEFGGRVWEPKPADKNAEAPPMRGDIVYAFVPQAPAPARSGIPAIPSELRRSAALSSCRVLLEKAAQDFAWNHGRQRKCPKTFSSTSETLEHMEVCPTKHAFKTLFKDVPEVPQNAGKGALATFKELSNLIHNSFYVKNGVMLIAGALPTPSRRFLYRFAVAKGLIPKILDDDEERDPWPEEMKTPEKKNKGDGKKDVGAAEKVIAKEKEKEKKTKKRTGEELSEEKDDSAGDPTAEEMKKPVKNGGRAPGKKVSDHEKDVGAAENEVIATEKKKKKKTKKRTGEELSEEKDDAAEESLAAPGKQKKKAKKNQQIVAEDEETGAAEEGDPKVKMTKVLTGAKRKTEGDGNPTAKRSRLGRAKKQWTKAETAELEGFMRSTLWGTAARWEAAAVHMKNLGYEVSAEQCRSKVKSFNRAGSSSDESN